MTLRWRSRACSLLATGEGLHQLQASNSRTRHCYGGEATWGRPCREIAVESAVYRLLCSSALPFPVNSTIAALGPSTGLR